MVYEGERHDHFRRTAIRQAVSFLMRPAKRRARVREVHSEWQKIRLLTVASIQIRAFHARRISIEGAGKSPKLAGDLAKNTRISAQIPNGCGGHHSPILFHQGPLYFKQPLRE